MNTANNKAQSHEQYITTTQKFTLRVLQATYLGLYAGSLLAVAKGLYDVATLQSLWGFIAMKFHRDYEGRVETLAYHKEWEVEMENEKAAKKFAEEFKEAIDKSKETLGYWDSKGKSVTKYSDAIEKLYESNKDWMKDIDTPSVPELTTQGEPTAKKKPSKKKKNG